MSNVYVVLNQLAGTSSRNEKLSILRSHANDATLKRVITLALDPSILFHIKKIPEYSPNLSTRDTETLDWAMSELSLLSNRIVTGNKAIDHLTDILESVSKQDAEVIERIISKDLRCGISTTAASVWPDMDFKFPVMLASAFNQKLIDKLTFPVILQQKLDGGRICVLVDGNEVSFFTRNGKSVIIDNLLITQAFIALGNLYSCSMMFDGELLVADANGNHADRKTGNGIINKAVKGTITPEETTQFRVVLWDAIPYVDFRAGFYNVDYQTRFNTLFENVTTLELICTSSYFISLVDTHLVDSFEEVLTIFKDYTDRGLEGVIIKSRTLNWSDKRSTEQIKLKLELDADLEVLEWQEGAGKNVGRLGALVCGTSDRKIIVGVGTGFSDEQRNTITKEIVGQIIAIHYNAKIQDKRTGNWSLFLPTFEEIRSDKDYANSFDELK